MSSPNSFLSINPYNQEILKEYPILSENDLEIRIAESERIFPFWRNTQVEIRAKIIMRFAELLEASILKLSTLISLEMGKVISESRAEILKCVQLCRFFAEKGEEFLRFRSIPTEAGFSGVYFEPTGAILGIMPWNFPFWQVFRFAIPNLMAGNVCILKHAPNVSGCALEIEKLFLEAGLPNSVFQTLIVDVNLVERILTKDYVTGLAFTGSEKAGSMVASLAGKHLKKSVLELGGSDPFLVLADADLAKASQIGVKSRMGNAGQACNGAKRFIVIESVYKPFLEAFKQEIKNLKVGNPLDEETTVGPLARLDLAQNLERQVQESIKMGALWDLQNNWDGCKVAPQMLTGVMPGMPVFDEETFGPVAVVISVKNDEEAIQMANHSRYGLAATLFTKDLEKARVYSRRIEAGNVFINAQVKSDPRLPFGGIKKSGFGRELSEFGMQEFLNLKTIFSDPS